MALSLVVGLLIPVLPEASVFKSGEVIHITNLHTVEDDFYGFGERVRVDGTIEGDLIVIAGECSVRGVTKRSADFFCRTVRHEGHIRGSLRAFAEQVTVTGRVEGSLVALGRGIDVTQGAEIARDANLYGYDVSIGGRIIGRTHINSSRILITGTINGNVELEGEQIIISRPAVITGNLTYESETEAVIDTANVTILGDITWNKPGDNEIPDEDSNTLANITLTISNMLAAFLFGIIVVRPFRPYAEESFHQLQSRFSVSLAAGFLGLLVFTACVVILMLALGASIAGGILIKSDLAIPGSLMLIASILLVPITSFASISGAIALYAGPIMVAYLVGFALLRLIRPNTEKLSPLSLFLGALLLTILCSIPYVGFLFIVLAALAGAGAIILGVKNCRKQPSG